jgi:DNA-binding transcriptional ArsR family regulator
MAARKKPPKPAQASTITPDATSLKALAHPVRLRILGLLRNDGPATATTLAARLGLNSGATSYHLRQLAQHGFITDDTERGNARDRWWRAAHAMTQTDVADADPEDYETFEAYHRAIAVVHTERLQQAVEEYGLLPAAWREATGLSDWGLRLTPTRARELLQALVAVVDDFAEDDEDTPDATPFAVHLHTFPRPGHVTIEPPGEPEPDR